MMGALCVTGPAEASVTVLPGLLRGLAMKIPALPAARGLHDRTGGEVNGVAEAVVLRPDDDITRSTRTTD